jgi:DUF4097 and DUF4098 domain-containing protein YvlB
MHDTKRQVHIDAGLHDINSSPNYFKFLWSKDCGGRSHMKTIGIFLVAILTVSLANATETSKRYDFEKTFQTAAGKKLDINLKSGGAIHIIGNDKNQVVVRARMRGEDRDNLDFNADESNGSIRVTSEYVGRGHNHNASSDLDIEVPSRFDVNLRTMGGDVSIKNVDGEITGQTMGGELNLQALKGNVQLTTMGGEVMLEDSTLDGSVKTMGGDVVIRNVSGSVKGSTMGGDVRYENPSSAGTPKGEVKINSMGGDLNVNSAPDGASLETMGGDIHVRSASKYVEAQTMGGNVELDAVDGWVNATTMGGNVTVRLTGDPSQGKRDVDLTSMAGDIELTVPEGMAMDMDLRIEFDPDRSHTPKIISDFPVKTWEEEGTSTYHGNRNSRVLRGTGQSGEGQHKVHIKTVEGDIIIKKG